MVGLVIGAVALVMILRTVEARKTWQDHYPHAAMHLFDAHMAQLKASPEANRCGATDTLPHLQALRMVANDLEPAFGDLRDRKGVVEGKCVAVTLDLGGRSI